MKEQIDADFISFDLFVYVCVVLNEMARLLLVCCERVLFVFLSKSGGDFVAIDHRERERCVFFQCLVSKMQVARTFRALSQDPAGSFLSLCCVLFAQFE